MDVVSITEEICALGCVWKGGAPLKKKTSTKVGSSQKMQVRERGCFDQKR